MTTMNNHVVSNQLIVIINLIRKYYSMFIVLRKIFSVKLFRAVIKLYFRYENPYKYF